MILDKEGIKAIIPHRDPFLLVDEVVEMEIGEKVVGKKYVREDEYYFQGHFPQKKVMPGVLIVEALAQTGAIGVLSMEDKKGKLGFLGSIKNAKFRDMVLPGDELTLEVELKRIRQNAGQGDAKAYVGDKLVCQCEIMFMIGE